AHRALDFYRGRAGEIEQAIGRVIAGVDELSAALSFEVRAPTSFEWISAVAAGAEAVLAAQPEDASDLAGVDHALGFLDDGHEELVVRGHVRDAGLTHGGGDLVGFLDRGAHRLFTQDVLPRGG